MAGFAHEDAELALARAAASQNTLQIISYNSSRDLEEITSARTPEQTQWFQIYINPDRSKTEKLIARVNACGCKALCITVDTNVLGRRERDMRTKAPPSKHISAASKDEKHGGAAPAQGVAQALGNFTDARLSWADLEWVRSHTDLPLILKGVQTGEDAVLAAQHGVKAIIISNHGGRQLDHARPCFDILADVMQALDAAGLRNSIEVYLDGGVRRGTDVYKALALGAKAVGIGRPAMYALNFGQEGVEKCLQMLHDEFRTTMQLMGRRNLAEIKTTDIAFKPAAARTWSDGWPLASKL